MEIQEEAMAGTTTTPNSSSSVDNEHTNAIIKGKRTKRRRLLPTRPVATAAVTPSTSSYSGEVSDSTIDEEEDMANCLILLAQGRALEAKPKSGARLELGEGGGARGERYTSRRLAEAATMANGKVSYYVYECKTCNKCFPSFQALGGHRSSHKKLKMAAAAAMALEEKTTTREQVSLQIGITSSHLNSNDLLPHSNSCTTSPALHKNNNNITSSSNKQKVHECSICGSEFSSGQALGGHMRRHRADQVILPGVPQEVKEKSGLALDLNLPAPAEDDRGASPSFFARKRPLVFSSSALVDCHY